MLGSAEIVGAVAERLSPPSPLAGEGLGVRGPRRKARLKEAPIGAGPLIRPFGPPSPTRGEGGRAFVVYDPVMTASSGDALSDAGFVEAVRARLLPLVDCLTPNLAEAAALLGEGVAESEADMARQGRALIALGPRAVLIKGGHLPGDEAVDLLVTAEGRASLRRSKDRLGEPARHRLHAVERDRRPRRPRQAVARRRRRGQGFRARGDRGGPRPRLGAGAGPLIQTKLWLMLPDRILALAWAREAGVP